MDRLNGQRIVIVGATGGIGSETARLLASRGARVAVTSRDAGRAEELRASLAGDGHAAATLDVTEEASVERGLADAARALGGIDTLINVPGLSVPAKIAEMSAADYDRTMGVNVRGMFLTAKHVVSHVDASRGGLIVAVSSMAAKAANPNAPVYCAAKASLDMLLAGFALQVKQQNVRVTTLNPGAVSTPGFWGSRPVPHEKFMTPADVAETIAFVCALPPRVVVHSVAFEPWEMFKTK